jgi:hypothetical protein
MQGTARRHQSRGCSRFAHDWAPVPRERVRDSMSLIRPSRGRHFQERQPPTFGRRSCRPQVRLSWPLGFGASGFRVWNLEHVGPGACSTDRSSPREHGIRLLCPPRQGRSSTLRPYSPFLGSDSRTPGTLECVVMAWERNVTPRRAPRATPRGRSNPCRPRSRP